LVVLSLGRMKIKTERKKKYHYPGGEEAGHPVQRVVGDNELYVIPMRGTGPSERMKILEKIIQKRELGEKE